MSSQYNGESVISLPSQLVDDEDMIKAKQSYKIAILKNEMTGSDLADYLAEQYREKNYTIQIISFDNLCNSSEFNSVLYDCLIMPDSVHYPAAAQYNIQSFTDAGGDLIMMGGYAFSKPVYRLEGEWIPYDDNRTALEIEKVSGGKVPKLNRLLGLFDEYDLYAMSSIRSTAFYEHQSYIPPISCAITGDFVAHPPLDLKFQMDRPLFRFWKLWMKIRDVKGGQVESSLITPNPASIPIGPFSGFLRKIFIEMTPLSA